MVIDTKLGIYLNNVSSCKILHFVMSYMKQNRICKVESAQYGLEIIVILINENCKSAVTNVEQRKNLNMSRPTLITNSDSTIFPK